MALLLPVLHRMATPSDAMGASTPDSDGTKPMSPTRSSSLASTSASSEMHYVVKNTFIDVSPVGSEEDSADMTHPQDGEDNVRVLCVPPCLSLVGTCRFRCLPSACYHTVLPCSRSRLSGVL